MTSMTMDGDAGSVRRGQLPSFFIFGQLMNYWFAIMFLNTELILNSDATLLPEAHPDVVRTMPVPSKLVEGRQDFYISIHVALKTPYSWVLQCDKWICLLLVLTCFMGCFSGDAWAFDSDGFVGRLSYDPQTKYYDLKALLASCACVGFCNCKMSRHYLQVLTSFW